MAEQEILPNPPDGNPIDVTAIPVRLSDMIAVRMKEEGVIVTFLRNEKPYAACVARVGIHYDKALGLVHLLVQALRAKGIDVQVEPPQSEGETGPAH